MIIANPIYDGVFKRLMEDGKVSKFLVGALLGKTIESLEFKPQEFTYMNKDAGVSLFRLDFMATIKDEKGECRKVLIEIQKAKQGIDVMRFRNYLGEQYKKKDLIDGEEVVLPITTIYILGFNLPEVKSACFRAGGGNYQDLIDDVSLDDKSDLVESLTHDSYFVQVNRIGERYQTRIDKAISVFQQAYFVDDKGITKTYNHEPDLEEVSRMTDILSHIGSDPKERKEIEIEQEGQRSIEAMLAKNREDLEKKLAEKDKVLDEKNKALDEKNKALDENKKVLDENKKVLDEKNKALVEKDRIIEELKRKAANKG